MSDKKERDAKKVIEKEMEAVVCHACGETDDHTRDCLVVAIDVLKSEQRFVVCPHCSEPSMDLNASRNYECRKCRSQFTTSKGALGLLDHHPDIYTIRDTRSLGHSSITVYALERPGSGDFPLDREIRAKCEKLDKLLREA